MWGTSGAHVPAIPVGGGNAQVNIAVCQLLQLVCNTVPGISQSRGNEIVNSL